MGVPKSWSFCSFSIANWEFELSGVEQALGKGARLILQQAMPFITACL